MSSIAHVATGELSEMVVARTLVPEINQME